MSDEYACSSFVLMRKDSQGAQHDSMNVATDWRADCRCCWWHWKALGLTVFGARVMRRPAPSDGPVDEGSAFWRTPRMIMTYRSG
jgi:hypothetical protein